jgi:hypothetical protein
MSPSPSVIYAKIGSQVGQLVEEKQKAYGDSFGKSGAVMRILYPDGIRLDQLDDALTVVRVVDKLFRIATDRDALGESPWRDIAGYSILSVARIEDIGRAVPPPPGAALDRVSSPGSQRADALSTEVSS